MIRGKKIINNKNISLKREGSTMEKVDYIYIPLVTYKNRDCQILVKEGDYVYKNQIVARSNDKYNFPIFSSVSGIVKGFVDKTYIDNNTVKTIKIENDFREKETEKKGAKKKINQYTKEELIELFKNCGVVGMSGNYYPTYYKYGMELKIKKLVINAIEGEPYLTTDYTTLSLHTPEILETIDSLMEIFEIEECVIALKDYNQSAMNDLIEYIGSYPKITIKTVPDVYPIGYEKSLIKYLYNIDIKKYPIEKGIIVNNISTIYEIYRVLKYRKPITQRIITISGKNIKNPQNILVKDGTLIKDIINYIGGYKNSKTILVSNGPMIGNALNNDDVVINKKLTGIIALDCDINDKELDCINCGKCVNICPVRLSPILIKNTNNSKVLEKLNPNKCVNCGLCSYICPSKIDLREIVNSKKEGDV